MGSNLEKYKGAKFIFVIGIGGSDLATKAVWNALTLHKTDESKPASSAGKKMFFLESPDEREYEEIENVVKNEIESPEEAALIVISKSGKTTETIEAFKKTFDILSAKFGPDAKDRVIVISSPDSPLWKTAEEKRLEKISWEENIGGRFSAFTVAHTTPLFIAGTNAASFISGGREGENRKEEAKNLASSIFESYKNGSTGSPHGGTDILDFFIFNSELEDLGKWCRQLIAESLGKQNKKGERVGLTPTVSIGPTDLHSMLQLDLGGPKNKFTIFLRSLKEIDETVNESAYENTVSAYKEAGLPHFKYEMPEINESELGKFMAFMMAVTLELAKLLGVNPYDQPEVEEYKKHLINN